MFLFVLPFQKILLLDEETYGGCSIYSYECEDECKDLTEPCDGECFEAGGSILCDGVCRSGKP